MSDLIDNESGLQVAESLARSVEEALLVPGIHGTLVSALYEAWYAGRHGRYPPGSYAEALSRGPADGQGTT